MKKNSTVYRVELQYCTGSVEEEERRRRRKKKKQNRK